MKTFLSLIVKEFIHIKRDKRMLILVTIGPLFLLFLFGYALRLQLENIPMVIFDEDKTFLSSMIKDFLFKEGIFDISEVRSIDEIRKSLTIGSAKVGLHIPKELSTDLFNNKVSNLYLFIDGTMPTIAIAIKDSSSILISEELERGLFFKMRLLLKKSI